MEGDVQSMGDHGPFWKCKGLHEMTPEEWESLCDGCGLCCLEKVEDEHTGEIREVSVSCEYLDMTTCRCTIYPVRTEVNPFCANLYPGNVLEIGWLPRSCAYRRVAEGKDLERWHPLVSGCRATVHEAGVSIRHRAVSGRYVHQDDLS